VLLTLGNKNLAVSLTPVKDVFTSVIDLREEFLSNVIDTGEAQEELNISATIFF
jgi:hypothetical protein